MVNQLEILEYIKNRFNTNIEELHEQEKLTHKYNVNYYDKIVIEHELEEAISGYNYEEEYKPLGVIIEESNFEQDIAIPNQIWTFDVDLSLLIKQDYIDDLFIILKEFIIKNKVNREIFTDETVMINISDGWDTERLTLKGDLYVTAALTVNFIIISGVLYSNDIKVYINGIELLNTALSLINETEMIPSLKKQLILGFIPNTSVFQVSLVSFFDLSNPVQRTLIDHISTSNLFNQTVDIIVKAFENTSNEIVFLNKPMFIKSAEIQADRGSVAVFKAVFVTPVILA